MRTKIFSLPTSVLVFWVVLGFFGTAPAGKAQGSAAGSSCDEFLVPKVEVNGKRVGQESCRIRSRRPASVSTSTAVMASAFAESSSAR